MVMSTDICLLKQGYPFLFCITHTVDTTIPRFMNYYFFNSRRNMFFIFGRHY